MLEDIKNTSRPDPDLDKDPCRALSLHSSQHGLHPKVRRGICGHEKRQRGRAPYTGAHDSKRLKKLLEGLADAWSLAVQLGDVLCKVFDRAGDVALAHAVIAVDVVATLAIVREPLCRQNHQSIARSSIFRFCPRA